MPGRTVCVSLAYRCYGINEPAYVTCGIRSPHLPGFARTGVDYREYASSVSLVRAVRYLIATSTPSFFGRSTACLISLSSSLSLARASLSGPSPTSLDLVSAPSWFILRLPTVVRYYTSLIAVERAVEAVFCAPKFAPHLELRSD